MRPAPGYPDAASVGELLGSLFQPLPEVTDEEAMACVGGWLAVETTSALCADFDDVWRVLTHLPDGYLRLLESPEGWAALSAIVAAELGFSLVPVVPAIH